METALTTASDQAEYERLVSLLRGGNVTVLTGAGLSTESGIPDYRGLDGKRRVVPMTYGEFVASPANRQRYWARSFVGWRRFADAVPNDGHRAVADLQRLGLVRALITQNVDGLHQLGGAHDVLELHGNLGLARCLDCGETTQRAELDLRLGEANPHFAVAAGEVRPDGDVLLAEETVSGFHPPRCLVCQSDLLKPDVVFFGESVPRTLVEQCFSFVEASLGLVVLGSSLQVMSGYRFVRRAAANGIPVAIVTRGPSRGDADATIRLDAPLGDTLTRIVRDLQP
ncbi:MAG: NAD-dependent protein deacetylase 1 [Dermatophilaceae bacterium]|nr:NAD-dependent protein deacetylase 1 [Dermatophilaceae bacterium]